MMYITAVAHSARPGPNTHVLVRMASSHVSGARPADQGEFIEVKGRADGADTVTVTKNEILTALNMPDDFILATVEVDGQVHEPRYLRKPFRHEPDIEVTSVTYDLRELLARAEEPG
ncbi:MAG TPA: DUF3883 domain-containing protein [Chloroflexota bacterium]|nr:DUF3883 domain-containing protein [Chloroflexota bacterium]